MSSHPPLFRQAPSRRGWKVALGLVVVACVGATAARADDPPAARLVTDTGTVWARPNEEAPWKALAKDKDVPIKATLIGLTGATVESENKGARVTFVSDLENRSPLPIIESAIVVNPSKGADLDFWLDRGRVDLVNQKEKGSALVRVRFRTRVWDLTLAEPGTRVALEIYSRWPIGVNFERERKEGDGPLTQVVMHVIKGEVTRKCPQCQHALTAPPGPALYVWDSIHGDDRAQVIKELPRWVDGLNITSPEAIKRKEAGQKMAKLAMEKSPEEAIKTFLKSESPDERRLAVFAAGAFDRLELLAEVLATTKHGDTWNNAVQALRHWIGRDRAYDIRLYNGLVGQRNFSPTEASTLVQLLLGFSEEEVGRPELYQYLINLLRHEKLGVRGLANWHLNQLAPAVDVAFNPSGPKEDWQKAYDAWRKAIPSGQMPPRPKIDDKKG